MGLAHFHALGRHIPDRAVQIELHPARFEQLALAHHCQHQQPRRGNGGRVRALQPQRAPERAQLDLRQVPVVSLGRHRHGALEGRGGVGHDQQLADGEVVDLLDDDADAVSRGRRVDAGFDDGQHVSRQHVAQRLVADGRVDVGVEPADDLPAVASRTVKQGLFNPALGERPEGDRRRLGGLFLDHHRLLSPGGALAGFKQRAQVGVDAAGGLYPQGRVGAQRHFFAAALEVVLEAPGLGTARQYLDHQAAAVRQGVWLFARPGGIDGERFQGVVEVAHAGILDGAMTRIIAPSWPLFYAM